MRIERVVARSFAEASEISRTKFGEDVLLLSSSRVGNSHELLICIDEQILEGPINDDGVSAESFREAMRSAIEAPPKNHSLRKYSEKNASNEFAGNSPPLSENSGDELIAIIREEIRALEDRLASRAAFESVGLEISNSAPVLGLGGIVKKIFIGGNNVKSAAEKFCSVLNIADLNRLSKAQRVEVLGPNSSGRSTVCFQLASLLSNGAIENYAVAAQPDPRRGARERFFSISDRAAAETIWGAVPEHKKVVVDVGGISPSQAFSSRSAESENFRILCVPSWTAPAAVAGLIGDPAAWDGLVITFWDDQNLPLSLLTLMADSQVPVLGLSWSEAPVEGLTLACPNDLEARLQDAMTLMFEPIPARLSA